MQTLLEIIRRDEKTLESQDHLFKMDFKWQASRYMCEDGYWMFEIRLEYILHPAYNEDCIFPPEVSSRPYTYNDDSRYVEVWRYETIFRKEVLGWICAHLKEYNEMFVTRKRMLQNAHRFDLIEEEGL